MSELNFDDRIAAIKSRAKSEGHALDENRRYSDLLQIGTRLSTIKTDIELGDLTVSPEKWQEFRTEMDKWIADLNITDADSNKLKDALANIQNYLPKLEELIYK